MPDYAAVLFRNGCMDVELNEARRWIKSVRPDVLIKRLGIQMRKSARWKFNGFRRHIWIRKGCFNTCVSGKYKRYWMNY